MRNESLALFSSVVKKITFNILNLKLFLIFFTRFVIYLFKCRPLAVTLCIILHSKYVYTGLLWSAVFRVSLQCHPCRISILTRLKHRLNHNKVESHGQFKLQDKPPTEITQQNKNSLGEHVSITLLDSIYQLGLSSVDQSIGFICYTWSVLTWMNFLPLTLLSGFRFKRFRSFCSDKINVFVTSLSPSIHALKNVHDIAKVIVNVFTWSFTVKYVACIKKLF